jgi:hypothetical protein
MGLLLMVQGVKVIGQLFDILFRQQLGDFGHGGILTLAVFEVGELFGQVELVLPFQIRDRRKRSIVVTAVASDTHVCEFSVIVGGPKDRQRTKDQGKNGLSQNVSLALG